tara:strand:- start:3097 stop:3546 length:450 start_codon:yes stop_codon:yes gene_type:complete
MAAFATISDILEYEPDIQNYGIFNFDSSLTKAQADVERHLRIHWWPSQRIGKFDITVIGLNAEMNAELLTESQLTRATVYYALAYFIYPQLSKFEPDLDVFQVKMDYYKSRFSEEMQAVIQDGVEYDIDGDGDVTDVEKTPEYFLRLQR